MEAMPPQVQAQCHNLSHPMTRLQSVCVASKHPKAYAGIHPCRLKRSKNGKFLLVAR